MTLLILLGGVLGSEVWLSKQVCPYKYILGIVTAMTNRLGFMIFIFKN